MGDHGDGTLGTGKYSSLTRHLAGVDVSSISLTFAEIDMIVGGLPPSARQYSAWWANEEHGHVQARGWLDAGFRVSAVELDSFVTFQRVERHVVAMEVMGLNGSDPVVTGRLDLLHGRVVADEGAAWLLADTFYAVLPDGSHANRVRPAAAEVFLVACWFSLRGIACWGRLIGEGGRVLSRAEGLALVDACSGVGEEDLSDPELDRDPSWTSVPVRAPERNWDLDAAYVPFAPEEHLLEPGPERDAGYAYPASFKPRGIGPWTRPVRPDDTAWIAGMQVDPACLRRGMRVWDWLSGIGTVLAVEPADRKTSLLVRSESGVDWWATLTGLEFADGPDLVRRGPDTRW